MLSDATHEPEWPELDDRLVVPETRFEMLDGELIYVSPADDEHGELHVTIAALIEAHSGMEFQVAIDLLTRTSRTSDVAPDVSVYLRARNPVTGKRELAQLAFEIVSTQTMRNAGRKAATLSARGVRRVFAIDLEHARVMEWSAAQGGWQPLDMAGRIEDPVFDVPLVLAELLDTTKSDDAVMRALVAKHNPVFEASVERIRLKAQRQGERQGHRQGHLQGRLDALLGVLAARGLAVDAAARARILDERDPARVDRWIVAAVRCASVAELVAES